LKKPGKISFPQLLLSLCSLSFLLLYFILSCYNRFAVDDYHYIAHIRNLGIWGSMQYDYHFWGGRWVTNLLWSMVYFNYEPAYILISFTFLNGLFLIASLFFLTSNALKLANIHFPSKFTLLNYCILTVMFVFLISPSKGEIWFWTASCFTYLLSISCFLWGYSIILSQRKNRFSYLLLALFFIYAGGASETYAITYILILLTTIIFIWRTKNSNFSASGGKILAKCSIALAILFATWIISILAPGNVERATKLPEASLFATLYIAFKGLAKLILIKILPLSFWIIPFSLISMYLGYLCGMNEEKIAWQKQLWKVLLLPVLLLLKMYGLLFFTSYSLSDIPPDRSLSQVLFIIVLYISGLSFYLGFKCVTKAKILTYGFYFSTLFIIVLMIETTARQQRIVSAYAAAADQRKEYLVGLQQAGNKKVITVKPLPSSGFLYSAEVTEDTLNFRNEHYEDGLGLRFKIKKEP